MPVIMNVRILIGLEDGASLQGATTRLLELGAEHVEPIENIPDALLAYIDDKDADDFIRRALALPGVRHAEHDQLKSTY